jgi:hypothetical protein
MGNEALSQHGAPIPDGTDATTFCQLALDGIRRKDLSKYISDMFLRRVTYLKKLIQRGIDNNEFTRQVDAESLAYVMMGTMMSVTLSWRMQNYSFSLTDKIQLITAQIGNVLTS